MTVKRFKGYVLNHKNIFGDWAYNGFAPYYLVSEWAIIDEWGNEAGGFYKPLKNSYYTEIINEYRGKEVKVHLTGKHVKI